MPSVFDLPPPTLADLETRRDGVLRALEKLQQNPETLSRLAREGV